MVRNLKQGDIIIIDLDPQVGHEQRGRRPAMVVNNNAYNKFIGMCIVCPITNINKDYPFRVKLDERTTTTGVIMCDQMKALDLEKRNALFIEYAPSDIVNDVIDVLYSFIEI